MINNNFSTASLIEEEKIVPKLVVKTLTDRSIKLDFTAASLTLGQLKEQLVEKVELPVEKQFFLLNGKVLGRDQIEDSLLISELPGFKAPEQVLSEFKEYEEKRVSDQTKTDTDNSNNNSTDETTNTIIIVKGIEELLPILYIFHYEPAAKAMDPLDLATDWDQKNRLKFFKGMWAVAERNFKDAADLLVESLPTFGEVGCIPYKDLVKYAVISAAVVFDRPSLKNKVTFFHYYHYITLNLLLFLRLFDLQKLSNV